MIHALLAAAALAQAEPLEVKPAAPERTFKLEPFAFPAIVQLNPGLVGHTSALAGLYFHPVEQLGVFVGPMYSYGISGRAPVDPLEAPPAELFAPEWAAMLVAEGAPYTFQINAARVAPIVDLSVAWAGAKVMLRPPSGTLPPSWGTPDPRPMFGFGLGIRARFGGFTVRIEGREQLYSSGADTVNGCTVTDLKAMDTVLRSGKDADTATTSPGCAKATFVGTDAATGRKRSDDVPLALALTQNPAAVIVRDVGLYVGIGWVF